MFDPQTFPAKFEQFMLDIALDREEPLSVDEVTALLRRLRTFFAEESVPIEYQRAVLKTGMRTVLTSALSHWELAGRDLTDVKRRWSEAVGFEISLPN